MSLPEFCTQQSLFGRATRLSELFVPDNRFRLFAEKIYPLLVGARPQLAACYCADNGRSAVEPVLVLGVSLLQFLENVPDPDIRCRGCSITRAVDFSRASS
jgi:hypothetical protein